MSIKAYCDACKLEISPTDNNVSILKSTDWKVLGKAGGQPVPKQEDFCCKCTEVIKKAIAGLKKV